MGVETCKECGEPLGLHTDMEGNHFCGGWVAKKYREGLQAQRMDIDAMRAELDTLRAQNAALISAAQKQGQREHELMMDRRELAQAVVRGCSGLGTCRWCYTHGWHPHDLGCPVALAERVLAEPVANPRAISGDKASDMTRSENMNSAKKRTGCEHG